jgi:hypothetical protein
MSDDPKISLDNLTELCITEGYTEAAYEAFSREQTPGFYLPPADTWYIKALLRDQFPDRLPPSVLEIEDMLIEDGIMPPRQIGELKLNPPRTLWPPRAYKARTPHIAARVPDAEAEAANPDFGK